MVQAIPFYNNLIVGDSVGALILKQALQEEGHALTCFAPEQLIFKFLQFVGDRINQQCEYFTKEIADNNHTYELTLAELRKKIEGLLGQNQNIKQICWQVEQKCEEYEERLVTSKQNTLRPQVIREQSKHHAEALESYLRNFEIKMHELQQQKTSLKKYLEDEVKQNMRLQIEVRSLEEQAGNLATELADLSAKNRLLGEEVCFKDVMIRQLIVKIQEYEYRCSRESQEFEDFYMEEHQYDSRRTLDKEELCTSRISQSQMNFQRYMGRSITENNDKTELLASMKRSNIDLTDSSKIFAKKSQLVEVTKINPEVVPQTKQAEQCEKSPLSMKRQTLDASKELQSVSYTTQDCSKAVNVNVYRSFFLLLTQCQKMNHRHFWHIAHLDLTYLYEHLERNWPFNMWQKQIRKELNSKVYKRQPSSFVETLL